MKRTLSTIIFILFSCFSFAQQIDWLHSDSIGYSANPALPKYRTTKFEKGVILARLNGLRQLYGNDILGNFNLERFDSLGNKLWTAELRGKVQVNTVITDLSNNLYVAGVFMETMDINSIDTLNNTGVAFNENSFLLSFDSNGNFRWKRNLSIADQDIESVTTLSKDNNGEIWYCIQKSTSNTFVHIDSNGNDLNNYLIDGSRLCSSFSFDSNGNLFISGATESGMITVNGYSEGVSESYMMFVTRIDYLGHTSWIRLAHDITFQEPQIVCSKNGEAFVAGNVFDSTSWQGINFPRIFFGSSFFIAKVDSLGNFIWGRSISASDTGNFTIGSGRFIDVDEEGSVYMTGSQVGKIHYSPQLIVNTGIPASYNHVVVKYDNLGNAIWERHGGNSYGNYVAEISVTGINKGVLSSGIVGEAIYDSLSTNQTGVQAALLVHFNDSLNMPVTVAEVNNDRSLFYPNPFNNQIFFNKNIEVNNPTVFSEEGFIVLFEKKLDDRFLKQLSSLSSGIYFFRGEQNGRIITNKIIKQ